MKVFWSWQSDTPSSTGKELIRSCLDEAVGRIGTDNSLDIPDRPEVDQDTQGVAGTPDVIPTILEKIRKCSVFVADVTFVGSTAANKKLSNPNVMIELGYALHVLDKRQIILIMNLAHGGQSKLPFDLKMGRWPLDYRLADRASQSSIDEVKGDITEKLEGALRASLVYAAAVNSPIASDFTRFDHLRDEFLSRWQEYMPACAARNRVENWNFGSNAISGYAVYCATKPSKLFSIDNITAKPKYKFYFPPIAYMPGTPTLGQPSILSQIGYQPAFRRWDATSTGFGLEDSLSKLSVLEDGSIYLDYLHGIRVGADQKLLPVGYILCMCLGSLLMADKMRRLSGDESRAFDLDFRLEIVGYIDIVYLFGVAAANAFRIPERGLKIQYPEIGSRADIERKFVTMQRDVWNLLGATLRDEEILSINWGIVWESLDHDIKTYS